MALRFLARKLRVVPATAAVERASYPGVPPATGSFASHSFQSGGSRRAVNGTRNGRQVSKDLVELEQRLMLERVKDKEKFEKISLAIDNLPRNIALACGGGAFLLTSTWAYLCGAFDGNRRKYPA